MRYTTKEEEINFELCERLAFDRIEIGTAFVFPC